MTRIAKSNALKAIHNNTIEENQIEDISSDKALTDNAAPPPRTLVPVITQNAPEGMTLDLGKQFKRKIEYCDRELMRIHNKDTNKNTKDLAMGLLCT